MLSAAATSLPRMSFVRKRCVERRDTSPGVAARVAGALIVQTDDVDRGGQRLIRLATQFIAVVVGRVGSS